MEIEKIYFDMDGVLADFDRGAKEICGFEPVPQGTRTKEELNEFWGTIGQVDHFYQKLEPIAESVELFRTLQAKYGRKCEILSAIPLPTDKLVTARADKIRWVKRVLGPDVRANVVYRREKADYAAGKGCILIDDYEKNIGEWESCGGTGIFFRSAAETLEELRRIEAVYT